MPFIYELESPELTMTNPVADKMKMHLWVVEAILDIPVQFLNDGKESFIYLNLGGDDPDGFVQMRPIDKERAGRSDWWSQREPIEFECRALVRAKDEMFALLRGKELYEHAADRLTLLTGYPVRVIAVGMVYDEDELKDCITGNATEYSATTGGEEVVKTQLPKNAKFPSLVMPPKSALAAIRWFRRGMIATLKTEQYLFYFFALESIAKHVPDVTRGPKRKPNGKLDKGLESQESAAIKKLLSRHKDMPTNARQFLAKIRARIAHGNLDIQTLQQASDNCHVVQRLALDGIALVYGLDPSYVNVLQSAPFDHLTPIMKAPYSVEDDPINRWGGGLLSDLFSEYHKNAKSM